MRVDSKNADVWVAVGHDKVKAEEYALQTEGNTVECFIEAKPGEPFEIHAGCATYEIALKLFTDGEEQAHELIRPTSASRIIDGRVTSDGMKQTFQFANIQLTDDDALACQDEAVVKNLGTIQVDFRRVIKQYDLPTSSNKYTTTTNRSFHESSKKARLSASVGYSEATYYGPKNSAQCHWIDSGSAPAWLSFKFHYRSADLLEADGIKPPSQRQPKAEGRRANLHAPNGSPRSSTGEQNSASDTPEPSSSSTSRRVKRELPESEREELARLREEMKQIKSRRTSGKQETDDDILEIKPLAGRSSAAKNTKGKVIVIEDSDDD